MFLQEPTYILLTSYIENKVFVNYCKEQGVDYFYEKPISYAKLKNLLIPIDDDEF